MSIHVAKSFLAIVAASLLQWVTLEIAAAGPYEDAVTAYENRDYPKALQLFGSLAREGDARAQYKLGVMYLNGQAVPASDTEALRWFRKAIDHKEAFEAYNRGDYSTALKLYGPLADRGETTAEYVVGLMYANGQGVPQSYPEAMKWHKKVADRGEALAQFSVGVMYLKGLGVPQNSAEASRWFRKAADQGNAKAQFNLGAMYAKGDGVAHDDVNAALFLSLAAASGIEAAGPARDKLLKSMTPAQIAKAKTLQRDWKPQPEK
jgi:TPR repeat protein